MEIKVSHAADTLPVTIFHIQGRINLGTADDLKQKAQAVFDDGSSPCCYKYEGGWFKKTIIDTGRHNEDYIEIISGLNESDEISLVKPDPDKIMLVDS